MDHLFFGGPLDTIRDVMSEGFKQGQVLRSNLLEAMLDARNSVGLNRRFKPAVLVLEKPAKSAVFDSAESELTVLTGFTPVVFEIFLVKIDFNSPRLVRVAGTLPPFALLEMDKYSKNHSKKKIARA